MVWKPRAGWPEARTWFDLLLWPTTTGKTGGGGTVCGQSVKLDFCPCFRQQLCRLATARWTSSRGYYGPRSTIRPSGSFPHCPGTVQLGSRSYEGAPAARNWK